MLLNQGGGTLNGISFFLFSLVSNRPLHIAHLGFCKSEAGPTRKKKANNCQIPAPKQTIIRFGLGMNDDAEMYEDKKIVISLFSIESLLQYYRDNSWDLK